MLDPFVDWQEFVDRIPGGVSASDEARARGNLQDACTLVREVAGKTYELEPPPDVCTMVAIAAARRAFVNPDGVSSSTIDDYTRTFAVASTSQDIFLTRREADAVRKAEGKTGLWTIGVSRGTVADVPSPSGPVPILDPPAPAEYDPFGEGLPL